MVVTQPMSSLAPKLPRPPVGQRTKRLSVSAVTSPDPEHSSEYRFSMLPWDCLNYRHTPSSTLSPGSVVQTGLVMGLVFAAFVMGVSLMGALWCIYYYTGNEISLPPSLNSYNARNTFIRNPKYSDWLYTIFDKWSGQIWIRSVLWFLINYLQKWMTFSWSLCASC